ncbi:hypothetical protein ACJJTC_004281 [Scirpophaga incertulas]
MKMGETEEFNTLAFEKRLMQLKDTQDCIQSLSSWCLKQRIHHKKIVSSWLNVLKRVKVEQRLTLFYLANDVIQYSKRKNYEFVESWGLNLQKATPLIWEQRSVYDEEFLTDLTGLLSAGAVKKTDDDALDFQPQQLVNKIKQCTVLEADTDLRLKYIHESHLQLSDAEALCSNLKERSLKDDVQKELSEGIACVERYTQALQREIVAREALLALLASGNQYYSTQRGEVKVVAYAYKNFGARVRALKRKLDELIPRLPSSAPSPPRRDEDVPSPSPDEDLDLPGPVNNGEDDISYNIDRTFNSSMGADGSLFNLGLSSFLNSDNALAMFTESSDPNLNSANKIEVINSRPDKQDFNINDFLKTLIPNESNLNATDNVSVATATMSQKSQDALPGLDLLTPESTGNPLPPTSFYGTLDLTVSPPRGVFVDTPESPPPVVVAQAMPKSYPQQAVPPPSDVDHRGILPPPPPPPVLPILGHMEDVDHRLLPTLTAPVVPPAPRHQSLAQDVDHRNLISLTQTQTSLPNPVPNMSNPVNLDQDYRVPPPMVPSVVPPSDIVESVDMDLSEDEEQCSYSQNPSEHTRRHSFNNNKVLVGGNNGKTNHNLIQINRENYETKAHTAPIVPMANPFDKMPTALKNLQQSYQNYSNDFEQENSNDSACEEDIRNRGVDRETRNPSPPFDEYRGNEWNQNLQAPLRPYMNPRFPRNWGPRTNFGPHGSPTWPRPRARWPGPRQQRFW